MPTIRKQFLDENSILGIWKITENLNFFYERVVFNEEDIKLYNTFNHELRKIHWLCVRVLMKEILSIKGRINISYDKNARPYFTDNSYHVSISHSKNLVAVLLSKIYTTGIDIEFINPKINLIAHKFLSPSELDFIDEMNKTEAIHVCWGAKEALYKMLSNSTINFIQNIKIKPFAFEGKGFISAEISTNNMRKTFFLNYEKIENYMLVYALDKNI